MRYLDVRVGKQVNVKVSLVSVAELRAIQKDVREKGQEIPAEGDAQVARVIAGGDTQEERVINEGDTQTQRASDEADRAEVEKDSSEVARNFSHDWATAPFNQLVNDGVNPIGNSSYHWSVIAESVASGLSLQGIWDPNSAAYPVAPVGGYENGHYWIVSASGSFDGVDYEATDQLVRLDSQPSDWVRKPNVTPWGGVLDVPENVSNALSRSGGTVSGDIHINKSNPTLSLKDSVFAGNQFKLLQDNSGAFILRLSDELGSALFNVMTANHIDGRATFPLTPTVTEAVPTNANSLTRKDYVDNGAVPIGGEIPYTGLIANIPSNWAIVDELVDKMILGTNTDLDNGTEGGSNDAVNISHGHTFTGTALANHGHTNNTNSRVGFDQQPYGGGGGFPGVGAVTTTAMTIDQASAGTPAGTINTVGEVGTNLNLSAYVKRIWIRRVS